MVNFVGRIGLVLALCLLVASQAFAYRIDAVAVEMGTGVTADTVVLTNSARALGNSLSIYGVWLTPRLSNSGNQKIYIGASSALTTSNGYELTVTGGSVRIPVDNLNKVWVIGESANSKVGFIADVK